MAYRRKHSMSRSSTFVDHRPFREDDTPPSPSSTSASPKSASSSAASSAAGSASSLATNDIRASAAHREASLSSAYRDSAFSSAASQRDNDRHQRYSQDSNVYEYTSMKSLNEPKSGIWGVLARKAKEMLDDGNASRKYEDNCNGSQMTGSTGSQPYSRWSAENYKKTELPKSEAIASSLRGIGGTLKNAFEEGMTLVENRTAGIIQETKKLQIRRKNGNLDALEPTSDSTNFIQSQAEYETQLKASRDVANAMAAKAKILLRELKTVKADLAFAKERCAQLEEENKILRESRDKGDNPADDDLIRLQLETLLAEKGRLAHENSVYARENRFLREIVEYHQLTMQDVVYLDEGTEEVTEVYRSPARSEHDLVISPALLSCSPTPNPVLPSSPRAKHAQGSSTPSSPRAKAAPGSPTFKKPSRQNSIQTLSTDTSLSPSPSTGPGDSLQKEKLIPPA